MDTVDISRLTDEELLALAEGLAADERERVCDMLEALALIDERRAYERLQSMSLHEYCVHRLRYSDAAAYRRIRAIRAIRLFPPVGELLRLGRLTLETVALLHPYLEGPDAGLLVSRSSGLRTWQVAKLLAERQAPPPQRDVVRFAGPSEATVPESLPLLDLVPLPPFAETAPVPPSREVAASKPPFSVRVAFTADERFWTLLQRAKAVLRHKYPDGRLESVLGDALTQLLNRKDRDQRVTLPSRRPPKMAE